MRPEGYVMELEDTEGDSRSNETRGELFSEVLERMVGRADIGFSILGEEGERLLALINNKD